MSALSTIVRALPAVPRAAPGALEPCAVVRGTGVIVGRWGDGYMLVRTASSGPGVDDWVDTPLTPLLTRAEIVAIVEWGVLAGDARVRTWPPLTSVLALGVLLANLPDAAAEVAPGPAPAPTPAAATMEVAP